MSNIFGNYFRVSTYGESHGRGIGAVIDGCPAGLAVSEDDIQAELNRRKPGQSHLTSPRTEDDRVKILSGILNGVTLGSPISLLVENNDQRSEDYEHLSSVYRPGHADFTYDERFGIRDVRGGGRSSNRESIARVASGAVAAKLIREVADIQVFAWVDQVYNISASVDVESVTREQIEAYPTRCPDKVASDKMTEAILTAKENGNSLGGIVKFCVRNCPAGLGSPVFKKITADLAMALIGINATRSFSIGIGEESTRMTGLEHNDAFDLDGNNKIITQTNRAGGVLGGITNGQTLFGTVAFKPVSTISSAQQTVTKQKEKTVLEAKGRHDPCVLPRAVPIVEAMISLVLADHILNFATVKVSNLKKIFQTH